jgi:hypothetical protein
MPKLPVGVERVRLGNRWLLNIHLDSSYIVALVKWWKFITHGWEVSELELISWEGHTRHVRSDIAHVERREIFGREHLIVTQRHSTIDIDPTRLRVHCHTIHCIHVELVF